jgi:diadenosine tetraphosphate (Ap4A) HIT family hydrolase
MNLVDNQGQSAPGDRALPHPMTSPFLDLAPSEWVASNELAFAVPDRFPVTPGHALVVPRRLVATYFEATAAEKVAL